jgi:hypothetical protein
MKKFLLVFIIFTLFLISSVSANDNESFDENLNLEDINENIDYNNELNDDEIFKENIKSGSINNDTRDDANIKLNVTNTTSDGDATIVITANPNATGNITVKISNIIYNLTLINGSAVKKINNLSVGAYNVDINYTGDINFKPFYKFYFQKFAISDSKTDLLTDSDAIVMYYRNGTKFFVKLVDSKGKPIGSPDVISMNRYVYITVNNVTYEKRLPVNGTVSLNLNLAPGNYSILTIFKGDYRYPASNLTTNLTILPTLIGNNITKYYRNGTQYSVKVLDSKGKALTNTNVKMNINGVFYERKTDSNGIATLNINLYPDEYIITVYHPETNVTFSNVIKVLPTLIGENLTKNFTSKDQYKVKALDDNGKPLANQNITINIHGVIYTKLTDNEGIAKLNINLNPDSYIATAYWNSYSTSNNIKVNN